MKQYKENQEKRQALIEAGEITKSEKEEFFLPTISYGDCRQIMTRTDFLDGVFYFLSFFFPILGR